MTRFALSARGAGAGAPAAPGPAAPPASPASVQPSPSAASPATLSPGQSAPADEAITLREMRWWDIDPVLVLERLLFPDDAWSRGMFWSELAHARGPGATRRYVVAESPSTPGELLGYAGLALSAGLADVQTIAVARGRWGTGLGARLLTDLLRHATAVGCAEVMLEVRVDNTRAQRLYHRFGFAPIGVRRGYYQPGNVDALVMRRMTPESRTAHDAPAADRSDPVDANGVQRPQPKQPEQPQPEQQQRPQPLQRPQQGPETHG